MTEKMKKIPHTKIENLLEGDYSYFDFCEADPGWYQRVLLVDRTVYVEDENTDEVHELIFRKEVEAELFFKALQDLSRALGKIVTLPKDALETLYRNAEVANDAVYLFTLFLGELTQTTGCRDIYELAFMDLNADDVKAAEEAAIAKARGVPAFIDCESTYKCFDILKHLFPSLDVICFQG